METEHMLGTAGVEAARLARGTVVGVDVDGTVIVSDRRGDAFPCVVLGTGETGVVLVAGDSVLVWHPGRPDECGVVLGRIGPSNAPPEITEESPPTELVIEATHSLTLRVGAGSITIREDGKILIKGRDLVSHAKRLNRIKGGAVQIN